MTKARNLSKIIDGSGNLVVPNAGSDARNLGMVKADGTAIDKLDRTTRQVAIGNATPTGLLSGVDCSSAIANGYVDPTYNSNNTYVNGDGGNTAQPNVPLPPNGNWWQWSGYGFSGVTTSNCSNYGSYDGAGGFSESFSAIGLSSIESGYSTVQDELGGAYQTKTVQNCNCGSFNCRTNCNCNCACACDCACRD